MIEDYFMRCKETGRGSYHIGGTAMVHSEDAGTRTPESVCASIFTKPRNKACALTWAFSNSAAAEIKW